VTNLNRLLTGLSRRRLGRKNSARLAKAISTVLYRLGLGGKAQGFYVPYRYADQIRPLGQDETIPWLMEYWDSGLHEIKALLDQCTQYNDALKALERPEPGVGNQPRFEQDWFSGLDGVMAYCMVRLHKPRTIIEVGSGHSTRFMRRAANDEGYDPAIYSIDPVPRKNIDKLCSGIRRTTADQVEEDYYLRLKAGDFLFIDGSHVAMSGTDVDYLLGRILPRLPSGVVVHFHDIFLPNGYPDNPNWRWWSYNEQYMVLTLLYPKGPAELLWASAYMRRHHSDILSGLYAPNPKNAKEASLWLRMK
jgi:predicted O-methyltransferase YrrM